MSSLIAFTFLPFVLLLLPSTTECTLGLDVSQATSINQFKCLKGSGYDFAIVRGYRSTGSPDPNAVTTLANAYSAGIKTVDVYMFPCPRCSQSAKSQVDEMVNSLNVSYRQIWLDIEGTQYWSGSYKDNQKFFEELLNVASGHKTTGVYASANQWSSIMGSDYTGGKGHQLWYVHYDGSPSFSDFIPFGGWSQPSIKQYAGNVKLCGTVVDTDFTF